jgi:two-component system LytT family response regulator
METQRIARVIIVDDEQNATALLKRMLEDYSVEIVGTASDANSTARQLILEKEPDLLFLDVELPSMLGLEFYTQIRPYAKPDMAVVFYTGYYMLKPPSSQELAKIMTRYYENRLSSILPTLPSSTTDTPQNLMIVNATGEHVIIRFQDIAFFCFNSDRKLWEVVTTSRQRYPLRHRTNADDIQAYSKDFLQIHKRHIVNVNHIDRVLDTRIILCPPLDDINELHISKNFRHDFMEAFYNL